MKNKRTGNSESAPASQDGVEPTFEEAFGVAEGAVERLERGNLPLEESMREYEDGLRALKRCYSILARAQKRIEVLSEEVGVVVPEAAVAWKPAASAPGLVEVIEHIERESEIPTSALGSKEAGGGP